MTARRNERRQSPKPIGITSADAQRRIEEVLFKPFSQFMSAEALGRIRANTQNKGIVGIATEQLLGLPQNSRLLDFVDEADLKTLHAQDNGFPTPRTTVAITTAGILDDIIDGHSGFDASHLKQKLQNTLFVGICRNGPDPADWFFSSCVKVDLTEKAWQNEFAEQWDGDYEDVYATTQARLTTNGRMRCTDGRKHDIQIRTKASGTPGNYRHLVSKTYGDIADKGFAWYLTHRGITHIIQHGLDLQAA